MGRKGYNSKARNVVEVRIDDSATKMISVDINHRADNYDECNALVLPSKKRTTKGKVKNVAVTKLLSKKRRKQLEKVVERKQKKVQRATLLEELAKVQASQDELKQYVSLTALQTKGLKRHFREISAPVKKYKQNDSDDNEANIVASHEPVINAIKGAKKKRLNILQNEMKTENSNDPNVVGFTDPSDSESESNNDEPKEEICTDNVSPLNKTLSQSETSTKIHSIEVSSSSNTLEQKQETEEVLNNVQNISNVTKQGKIEKSSSENLQQTELALLEVKEKKERVPAVFVPLNRKPDIQAARLKLPVVAEEQAIVETINENSVIIITGETGSGKTTQVPQFLYEAGYAKNKLIGITEPRRVAAMSMSKRVATEMNLTEKEISYLIRFEGNVTPDTKIKFMTDGVLLKEIQSDLLLTKYSIIILDEAHERSVYTDILIGLLSRIVPLRNKRNDPLKLIIMSATLRVDDFVENRKLFKQKPPVISVESRQFPVTVHFNKHTLEDYVSDAFRKAVKIHTRLPEGGILIFLTGQQEVNLVVRKLRKTFSLKKKAGRVSKSQQKEKSKNNMAKQEDNINNTDSEDEFDARLAIHRNKQRRKKQPLQLPKINLDDYTVIPTDDTHEDMIDGDDLNDLENLDENESEEDDLLDLNGLTDVQPLWVLPLYSLLPSHKQAQVFEPPPEDYRLCVVATNVAETSLTIPNIKYVIDCGRCKMRLYDKTTGVSTYQICYTSKAAANQRAGRAGRTGPGHCYRLYSSAVFNDQFEQFSQSEIQRKPVDDLLLQMKVMNIDKVINFPFPTPPDIIQLKSAERRLCILGALQQNEEKKMDAYNARVSPLGYSIAAFPVTPRYGKMLALSHQHDLLKYSICMVAALSVQEVLIEAFGVENTQKNKWSQIRRMWAGTGNSLLLGDPMVLIRAVGAAEYANCKGKILTFCEENGLRHKAVVEIRKLRQQLTNEINLNIPDINLGIDPHMSPPSDVEARLLRQIVLAGMVDQIARKVSPDDIKDDQDKSKWKHAYKTLEMEDPVFMHSSCVLRKTSPEWVVYQEVYETKKMYMRGVTVIQPEWLPKFAPSLCQLSEPLSDPPPRYDDGSGKIVCNVTGTFGKPGWELPMIEIDYPMTIDGVRWFAYFFLDGQVCPKLKRFVPSLLSSPSSVNKSWAKLIPRTEVMTKTLMSESVMSKDKLLETWKLDKTFLLSAYQKWLPESAHVQVSVLWPPV